MGEKGDVQAQAWRLSFYKLPLMDVRIRSRTMISNRNVFPPLGP